MKVHAGGLYTSALANAPQIQKELANPALRRLKVFTITHYLARGKHT